MSNYEVYTTLVLSTTHISQEDGARLDIGSDIYSSPMIVRGDEYSWRIYIAVNNVADAAMNMKMSPEFIDLIKLAQVHGCRYLELDRDGQTYEGLPTFNW